MGPAVEQNFDLKVDGDCGDDDGEDDDDDAYLVEELCVEQVGLGTLGLDIAVSSSPIAVEAQISCRP